MFSVSNTATYWLRVKISTVTRYVFVHVEAYD